MADQKDIDELIKMLDSSMSSGTGHVNVQVKKEAGIVLEEVSVEKGMGCSSGDTACNIPNLPMDDDEK